jgi:hypothetical protein
MTDHLVSLVGSNPLSSFAAITALQPAEVTLVHTAQTLEVANLLADVLDDLGLAEAGDGPSLVTTVRFLEVPATDAMRVRHLLEDLGGPWALDYTGGTKAMSSAARLAYEYRGPRLPAEHGGGADPAGACYVDDGSGMVRSDDGQESPIDEGFYRLRAIARLHSCGLDFTDTGKRLRSDSDGGFGLENRVNRLANNWLSSLKEGDGAMSPPQAIYRNLKLNFLAADGRIRKSELDITVHRGRRIGVVSCFKPKSEARSLKDAKLKLFEVIERSRQLGGDLSRAALATTLVPRQIELLRADLGPRWDPRGIAVFSEDDLKEMERGDFSSWNRWWGHTGP